MKCILLVLSLLLIVSCTHVLETPLTSSPLDVDGAWKGLWDNRKVKDGQPLELFIVELKSDGNAITGRGRNATLAPDIWFELKKIVRKGDTLYFSATPLPELKFKCKAQIDGDIMNVTFKWGPFGAYSDSVTLEREKKSVSSDSAAEWSWSEGDS